MKPDPGALAERRSGEARARPANFQPGISEAAVSVPGELTTPTLFPKPTNATYAMYERARRTWTKKQRAENLTEEQLQPKPGKGAL